MLSAVAVTVDPLLMRTLIDNALPHHDIRWALRLVAGIGLCYFGRASLSAAGSLVNFSIIQQCARDLRTSLLDQLNRLSADYHEDTPTGEKLTRLDSDVEEIANIGASGANQSVRALLFVALNMAMMAKLSASMTLIVFPLLPLFIIFQRKFRNLLKLRSDAARVEVGLANSLLTEHLSAIPQIQFLAAEETTAERAGVAWNVMLRAQWDQRQAQVGFSLSISVILAAAIVLVLAFGSSRVLAESLTVGGLVAFYAYITRLFDPVSSAMDLYSRLQSIGASIRRVRGLLALEPTVRDIGTRRFLTGSLKQGVTMADISFSYGNRSILKHLTLHVDAGEHVALIGASGSGKSTLTRLLVRAADPHSGDIRLDQHSLVDYTLASLRCAVCYVPQQPVFFEGTIRHNLLYANPNARAIDLDRAIEAARLTDVVERLPNGLDALLGPGAIRLSGGERQRLAIARALLRNSAVLVLDESTSALDTVTEKAVLSSVTSFTPGQTIVIVSHRIASLTWINRFILLDQGSVAAMGSHPELYRHSYLYRTLFDASYKDEITPPQALQPPLDLQDSPPAETFHDL